MKLFELREQMLKTELSNLAISEDITKSSCGGCSSDDLIKWLDLYNRATLLLAGTYHLFRKSVVVTPSASEPVTINVGDSNYLVLLAAINNHCNTSYNINPTYGMFGVRADTSGNVTLPQAEVNTSITLEYAYKLPTVTIDDINSEILVPVQCIELVRTYIAHHYYHDMNSPDNIAVSNTYYNRFNEGIANLQIRNTVGLSESGNVRFRVNGFL